jgi:hypothetical protein
VEKEMRTLFEDCVPGYSWTKEDRKSYVNDWGTLANKTDEDDAFVADPWYYNDMLALDG